MTPFKLVKSCKPFKCPNRLLGKISRFARNDKFAAFAHRCHFDLWEKSFWVPDHALYALGHLRFSVHTSGGGGTIERPLAVSTIDPSAGQYIRQTVHPG